MGFLWVLWVFYGFSMGVLGFSRIFLVSSFRFSIGFLGFSRGSSQFLAVFTRFLQGVVVFVSFT